MEKKLIERNLPIEASKIFLSKIEKENKLAPGSLIKQFDFSNHPSTILEHDKQMRENTLDKYKK